MEGSLRWIYAKILQFAVGILVDRDYYILHVAECTVTDTESDRLNTGLVIRGCPDERLSGSIKYGICR